MFNAQSKQDIDVSAQAEREFTFLPPFCCIQALKRLEDSHCLSEEQSSLHSKSSSSLFQKHLGGKEGGRVEGNNDSNNFGRKTRAMRDSHIRQNLLEGECQ